jgi:hypothetical protein
VNTPKSSEISRLFNIVSAAARFPPLLKHVRDLLNPLLLLLPVTRGGNARRLRVLNDLGVTLVHGQIKTLTADQSLAKSIAILPILLLRLQSMRLGDCWAFECWSSAPTVVVASSIKDCW